MSYIQYEYMLLIRHGVCNFWKKLTTAYHFQAAECVKSAYNNAKDNSYLRQGYAYLIFLSWNLQKKREKKGKLAFTTSKDISIQFNSFHCYCCWQHSHCILCWYPLHILLASDGCLRLLVFISIHSALKRRVKCVKYPFVVRTYCNVTYMRVHFK